VGTCGLASIKACRRDFPFPQSLNAETAFANVTYLAARSSAGVPPTAQIQGVANAWHGRRYIDPQSAVLQRKQDSGAA
jgi:hypothetical protein